MKYNFVYIYIYIYIYSRRTCTGPIVVGPPGKCPVCQITSPALATSDKRTESGTNPRYSFGLYGADRLSAQTGAAGCSRSRDTVIHSAGRYSEESRINNISVKSCEKHSNSAQNYVKVTDIRTNATDVETKRNIVQ